MNTDLEQRLVGLANAWERETPAITIAELVAHPRRPLPDPDLRAVDIEPRATDAATIDSGIDRAVDGDLVELRASTSRPDRRRLLAFAAALLMVVGGAVVLARRSADRVEPVSPASTVPAIDTSEAPTTSTASATTPSTAPAETAPPVETSAPSSVPTPLPEEEVVARLADIFAEQRDALRAFTTIGFTVTRTQTLPDGTPYSPAGSLQVPARVVVRNDGSAAVVSESFGRSYYDANTGSARAIFTNPDGTTGYQQVDGQMDSSLGLGIPTGLANGVVARFESLTNDVVAIEEEVLDGRNTWRIDQYSDLGAGSLGASAIETSTWIDRVTGITLQTRSSGAMTIGQDDVTTPITDVITLSDLVPNEPMPADFASPFPPDAPVAVSGDATQYGPITYEAAALELGPGAVVPTIAADQVSVQRIVFGEGLENVGVTLFVRWFDGFVRTELSVLRFPVMMEMPASCVECDGSLLDQLRAAEIGPSGVTVQADGYSVGIAGDPERIRAIIDSLVVTP